MTKPPDLYGILGVPPNSTRAEISRAYRALVRRHHPDTRASGDRSQSVGSDTTLQQVLAAYSVLRDPRQRADYDRETKPAAQATRQESKLAPRRYGDYGRPPIIVGPVRWHCGP